MINLELFRVFYTVAKCGSLTKAAKELYISQPAVSQAIKQLEFELGGKLFNRVSKGVELTENGGKPIFEYVSKAIELLEKAENKFTEINNLAIGSLKISAPDTVITHILMPYIINFHKNYPSINISFINGTSKDTLETLKANKADIGFVNLPVDSEGVNFVGKIDTLNDVFVVSEKYKELINKPLNVKDLTAYPLIMLEQGTATRREFTNFTKSLGVELTPEFELASLELCVEMAKNGMGIACVSKEFIKKELQNGELFILNVEPKIPTRGIGVILNKTYDKTFALNEFLKMIKV